MRQFENLKMGETVAGSRKTEEEQEAGKSAVFSKQSAVVVNIV